MHRLSTAAALFVPLVLSSLVLPGCGDDAAAPEPAPPTAQVEGKIESSNFELKFPYANGHSGLLEGPFLLRGSALRYDSLAQALTVDLTITNRGIVSHPEPVGLTFVRLFPHGVTVLNADNGVNGDGAAILFSFANDDAMWTPGETSLPRTVQFSVAPGVAVGFIGRIDIGGPAPGGGSISGRVWHDMNKDGVTDDGEPGLGDVPIALRSISGAPNVQPQTWFTRTRHDGTYAFEGLRAGAYVVSKALATVAFIPTTPTEITVLLAATDDGVSHFTGADFGCVPGPTPPPIVVGAYIEVEGRYMPEPHRVMARDVMVKMCGDALTDDGPDNCREGKLRGPVTAVAEREPGFAVMGTWVVRDPGTSHVDVTPGQRLDVRVRRVPDLHHPLVTEIQKWDSDHEQVHGRVDAVEVARDGTLLVKVFNTLVVIGRDAHIHP